MAPIRLIRPDVKPAVPTDEQVQKYLTLLACENAQALQNADFESSASAVFAAKGLSESTTLAAAVLESLSSIPSQVEAFREEFLDPGVLPCVLDAFLHATGHATLTPQLAADFVRFCVAYRIHCYFQTSLLAPVLAKPAVVFILGGPGAGKGTQCERISQTFGYYHLSAGDLLREERKREGSEYGQLIESYIKEGKLVPVEIVVNLLKQAMEKHGWSQGKFLVDGFPRSFENMEGWERVLGGKVDVKFALFFNCSETVMEARILERGKTSGRADDNPEAIKKRLATFTEESVPVVKLLQSQNLLRQVQCEKAVEEVWKDVRALFGPTVVFVLGGPGAGKGTLCGKIVESCGYKHLSAGDLLREERKRTGSKFGELIEAHIKEGKLVPANITVELLLQAMREQGWEGGKYLIDGFPRSFDNLEAWQETVRDQVLVRFVLYLDVSEQVMEARLLERGKTSGRADDNIESIRKRFLTFHKESMPVVEHFQKQGRVRRIDAEQHADAVWRDVQVLFGPSVVFVLGGPGAGKGTQCSRIAETFGYTHLSAGDLLREERNREGSEYGELINNYIKEGKLVPVEITIKLLKQAMMKFGWEGGRYLVDGFPRSFDNLRGWEEVIGNTVRVKFVLFFDLSEETMQARLVERGKTSGRADDNLESIKKRFITFQQESMPVVEKFHFQGLVRRINAEQSPEKVWRDVERNFGPSVIFVLGGPGAGKGTQCTRIAANFGFQHLSAGDLLREERKRPGSELGELIENHIKEGKLVPVSIVVQLLQKAMEDRGWEDGKYLIDGFPRSAENLRGWNEVLGTKVDVKCCLFFDCSEEVMEARLLERGKTSGRADDNLESIRKRFATYKEESLPVVEMFSSEGLLRRISAEQNLDEVWSCVREVMHNEQDGHLLNQAVVLIKPSSFNKETQRFVQSFFTTQKISVVKKGIVSAQEIAEKKLFDAQYLQLVRYSKGLPDHLQADAAIAASFQQTFGVALSECAVLGADAAQESLKVSPEEMYNLWTDCQSVKLAPSLYVGKIGTQSNSVFVVNGFVPHWRAAFSSTGEACWFVVEFNPSEVSWKRFEEILGATDPSKASSDSIRGLLYQHYKDCGLTQQPTTMDNGVHFSAGALEGMRERMLWTNITPEEDPLGRLLLSSGVPRKFLDEWMDNPDVDGWYIGTKQMSGPLFACTEACDTVTFKESAIRFLQEKGESLHCSTLRARKKITNWTTETTGGEKPKKMTILHFNDVYNVEPRAKEPVGGIARFVTRIKELKAESVARGEHEAVVLFSGDAFNPSLMHMITALNAIGIHTACYGNHDFDFGVDNLEALASQNNFPWLISNVTDKKTGRPLASGIVTRMMDFHGRKVGLIGLVEKEWLVTLATINPSEVEYEDFVPCARRLAKQLKEHDRAEIVIALTHMRVPNDELLAHEVSEVDIILAGHDHHYDVKPVGPHGTYVLKSGTDFRDITVLQLEFTDEGPKPYQVTETQHVEIDGKIAECPTMKSFVDECMTSLGAAMDQVVGATAVDLDSRFASIRTQETNLGNFVVDVMRFALKADVAMLNSGTLRADAIIERGDIKVRDLVNLLPMLDELCLLQLTGTQVLSALENSVSQYPRLEGRFAQVSGVSFTFDAAKTPLERIDETSIRIGGEPIQRDKNYKLVTKDYLRKGKDGYDIFMDGICLADGEQAGILPSIVRDCFASLELLNGESESAKRSSTFQATRLMEQLKLEKVGDGPDMLKRYAINPSIEGRIVCLNPA